VILDEFLVVASALVGVATADYFGHFGEYFARSPLFGTAHGLLVEFEELYVLQFFPSRPFTLPALVFQQGFGVHSGDLVTRVGQFLRPDDRN
jgi:hypothetical protein